MLFPQADNNTEEIISNTAVKKPVSLFNFIILIPFDVSICFVKTEKPAINRKPRRRENFPRRRRKADLLAFGSIVFADQFVYLLLFFRDFETVRYATTVRTAAALIIPAPVLSALPQPPLSVSESDLTAVQPA